MSNASITTISRVGLVLAVHPSSHGFGWVLFESPLSPVAWALVHAKPGHEAHLLASFKRLLLRYEPAVVVLEAFETGESRRSVRIRKLCRAMLREAAALKVERRIFERDAVRSAFARFGAMTRSEIAQIVAQRVDGFAHRLPPRRRPWTSQDARQSLFDAAALAVTYFVAMGDHDWPA